MRKRRKKGIRVFFSAPSITSKNQRELYEKIRQTILDLGANITYDWLKDKKNFNPRFLAKKAAEAIKVSDIVVAEMSEPSTGVGLQIALANAAKIPVISLFEESKHNQSTVVDTKNEMVVKILYNIKNLEPKLSKAIKDLLKNRFVKFNFISTQEINDYLEKESTKYGITRSEYLRQIIRGVMSGS